MHQLLASGAEWSCISKSIIQFQAAISPNRLKDVGVPSAYPRRTIAMVRKLRVCISGRENLETLVGAKMSLTLPFEVVPASACAR